MVGRRNTKYKALLLLTVTKCDMLYFINVLQCRLRSDSNELQLSEQYNKIVQIINVSLSNSNHRDVMCHRFC